MNKRIKKVLFYYMIGVPGGGSDHSLFNHLNNLDLSKIRPIVIYRDQKNLVLQLQQNGILIKKDNILILRNSFNLNQKSCISKKLRTLPGSRTIINSILSFLEIIYLFILIIKYDIDLIHFNHGIDKDRRAIIAGILTRRKMIVHHRGFSKLNKLDVFLTRFVKKIVCISNYSRDKYISYGVAARKCITIYNGVDLDRFRPSLNKAREVINIGNIGRLETFKGVDIFLQAIPKVLEVHANSRFTIVGSGSQKKILLQMATELGIDKFVTFADPILNIEKIYNTLNIMVHSPVEPEPFGRVIIEAMACSIPVISTNVGGPIEIITHEFDGFLIPPRDSIRLAQQINFLIENPQKAHQIAINARETVRERFDIKKTTQIVEDLYYSIWSLAEEKSS